MLWSGSWLTIPAPERQTSFQGLKPMANENDSRFWWAASDANNAEDSASDRQIDPKMLPMRATRINLGELRLQREG
jgi:hypothetical protein